MAIFGIYKRGQGKYTRMSTFIAATVIAIIGAGVLSRNLDAWLPTGLSIGGFRLKIYFQYGVPTLLVVLSGGVMFWLVNRQKSGDFLIATEGEMKKVSWSSKKELIGSTKVVLVTTFIMAMILFAVDILFTILFKHLGIMG